MYFQHVWVAIQILGLHSLFWVATRFYTNQIPNFEQSFGITNSLATIIIIVSWTLLFSILETVIGRLLNQNETRNKLGLILLGVFPGAYTAAIDKYYNQHLR